MIKTNVREIYKNHKAVGFAEKYNSVQLSGWVRTNRASKSFGFIELNDGTFLNQFR